MLDRPPAQRQAHRILTCSSAVVAAAAAADCTGSDVALLTMAADAPQVGDTLCAAACKVLHQPEPTVKAQWTQLAADLWRSGGISETHTDGEPPPPDTPARSPKVPQISSLTSFQGS